MSELTLEEMPLAKLQRQLQGSASLPIWFWCAIAASTLIPALFLLAVILIAFKKFRSRDLGTELRRMKAFAIFYLTTETEGCVRRHSVVVPLGVKPMET